MTPRRSNYGHGKRDQAAMTEQKETVQRIFKGTWSQLDPDQRNTIFKNHAVLEEVLAEIFPGTKRRFIVRQDEGVESGYSSQP